MGSFSRLMQELDERVVANLVFLPHEEARNRYRLPFLVVSDFAAYENTLGNYYAYHFAACVAPGGVMPLGTARSRAKAIISNHYRRQNGDIVTAYNDAAIGTNGGLRAQIDLIAESLQAEGYEHYVTDVFDRHVAPTSWSARVALISEFLQFLRPLLPPSVRLGPPEEHARDWQSLIRLYLAAMRPHWAILRRL